MYVTNKKQNYMQGNLDVYSTTGKHKFYSTGGNSFHQSAIPNLSKNLTAWHWLIVSSNPPSLQFHLASSPGTFLFFFIKCYLKCCPVGNLMELMAHCAFCLVGETKDSTQTLLFSVRAHI